MQNIVVFIKLIDTDYKGFYESPKNILKCQNQKEKLRTLYKALYFSILVKKKTVVLCAFKAHMIEIFYHIFSYDYTVKAINN